MSKVALQVKRDTGWHAPGRQSTCVQMSLPFYKSDYGRYTHRVRRGSVHWADGNLSGVCFELWCGALGHLSKGALSKDVPSGQVACATCEGRAIGAGLDGAREINGRAVMFSPKARR